MRVHVVSDVHGNAEALSRAGDGADALFVLGDLLDLVDYHDHSGGILGRAFGPDVVSRFAELRRAGRPGELSAFARALWARFEERPGWLDDVVREQYAELFAVLPEPTYVIPGNVDMPHLWPEFARAGVRMVDGELVRVGDALVGFVGGLPVPPGMPPRRPGPWRPHMRSVADFDAAVAGLAGAEVLCSHAPPAVPELAYDVVARRPELASTALAAFIRAQAPRTALFGHVHQPLCGRMRIGRTECVNVGHFQRTTTAHVLRL